VSNPTFELPPAGGLFTGAETIKTAADVALWGGLAGQQMDVCYHDPCDSLTPEQDNAPAGVHDALAATGYSLYGNLNTYATAKAVSSGSADIHGHATK
jgi:hypothetical protein